MNEGNQIYSPELDRWLVGEVPGLSHEEALFETRSAYLSLGYADGGLLLHASPNLQLVEGAPRQFFKLFDTGERITSEDLSTVYAVQGARLLSGPADPRPDYNVGLDSGESDRIYELSGLGGPDPTLKLAAEVPLGLRSKGTSGPTGCAIDSDGPQTLFQHREERLVSADGSTLLYTAPIENAPGRCGEGTPNPIALFAHHGESSVQLNAPPLGSQCHSPHPCATSAPAVPNVDGISPDGSRAWFTTTQPLIDSDADTTRDLYLAKLENGAPKELVQASAGEASLSHPTPGVGANVQGVLGVSPDGSHVAFVATGVLTTSPDLATGQSAALGADNLYVYDATSGETKFVARFCSGTEESGSVIEPRCFEGSGEDPWRIEVHGSNSARFTPDGRYLLFSSRDRLTSDDTDTAVDVYRYDFQAGRLIRVSFGRDGNDANGNDNRFDAILSTHEGGLGTANELAEDSSRAISADGSVVVFETAAPLVSGDTNAGAKPGCNAEETGCDVYEWEEQGHGTCRESAGCIRLLSDGVQSNGSKYVNISSSGRDITFWTERGLSPADTDGVGDIYDARENGGFPYVPPSIPCGGNEICHHQPPSPPAPPNITSAGETGGNGSQQLNCAKGKVRVKKHGQVRCVAKKTHKAKRHRKHKRAGRNGGGAK